jgi:hypothetical protein
VRAVVDALRDVGRQLEAANSVAAAPAVIGPVTAAIPIIREPS